MKKIISIFILVLLFIGAVLMPVSAAEKNYVFDETGILSEAQLAKLEQKAVACAQNYNVGVYFALVDNFKDMGYGDDIYVAAYSFFDDNNLGEGDGSGIILMLSLSNRDYASFVRGEKGEYAFDEYGLIVLEEEFLPYFGENQWFEGADCYFSQCAKFLEAAENGEPVREGNTKAYAIGLCVSVVLAFIICTILKAQMKSVAKAAAATAYISGELRLTHQRDQFTHHTVHRRKIEKSSSSSGSSARSGGGGHGRSGKF
ncbi:MAG: TPM domain-containing protein [Oscillospiraceae bacterium]|nr:TPM domain-containing protein [Oscillospiraceae bacterium]